MTRTVQNKQLKKKQEWRFLLTKLIIWYKYNIIDSQVWIVEKKKLDISSRKSAHSLPYLEKSPLVDYPHQHYDDSIKVKGKISRHYETLVRNLLTRYILTKGG